MKSRCLELIPDFQNNIETLNVISAWPFSASVDNESNDIHFLIF